MKIYLGDLFHTWTKGGIWTIPLNIGYVGSYTKKKFEEGVSEMLKDIEYWKDAPLWDMERISKATETWFKYMDKEKN